MSRRGVALGGFMASGKSTVGRLVAQRLGLPFVDLDLRVEEAAGRTVAALFATGGELEFRRWEEQAVEQVVQGPDAVVALGGGTLHHGANRQRLAARFPIVVLDPPLPVLLQRLAGDATRPLAVDAARLWSERRPGYLAAGRVIATGDMGPEVVAARVLEALA